MVAARQTEFAEAQEHALPDNWEGEPLTERRSAPDVSPSVLAGLGVSVGAGPVTGRVRIVLDAIATSEHEIEPGEILVAPFTDAPWTPMFVPAGAVVVETGGVLSHAATVAREFGIPCVLMVKDATRLLCDGELVAVDGAAGTVTRLAPATAP